jgi:hypothetical protein
MPALFYQATVAARQQEFRPKKINDNQNRETCIWIQKALGARGQRNKWLNEETELR